MFTEGEWLYQENIIPFDEISCASQEFDYLFGRKVSPLPIPSTENYSTPITPQLNKEIPFEEEVSNLAIEISQTFNINEIKENANQLRGRKRKSFNYYYLEADKKLHNKFRADNIFIKIKAHYQKFIIDFFNTILETFGFKEKFIKINYVYIKNLNKKTFHLFKNESIFKILEQNISPKFSTKNEDTNIKIINIIKTNPIINNLLFESYINLFKNVYYKSERCINLKKYGLNVNIKLPEEKVQMYSDLIGKFKGQKEYIERLNDYTKKKFIY